jgi:tRNA-Thr(GGU) m(6)t(6)A37 methyltransferase TsaA
MSRMTFTVTPIGHVRSPLADPAAAPRQPDEGAPPATLVIDDAYLAGLDGVDVGADLLVLTWLHQGSRDVLSTRPRNDPTRPEQGVFSTRSPDRPNPIGLHRVSVIAVDRTRVRVRDLEALDGTPIIDVKPVLDVGTER